MNEQRFISCMIDFYQLLTGVMYCLLPVYVHTQYLTTCTSVVPMIMFQVVTTYHSIHPVACSLNIRLRHCCGDVN